MNCITAVTALWLCAVNTGEILGLFSSYLMKQLCTVTHEGLAAVMCHITWFIQLSTMHQFTTTKNRSEKLDEKPSIYSLPVEEGWGFPPSPIYPIVIFWVCQGVGMTNFINLGPLCPFAWESTSLREKAAGKFMWFWSCWRFLSSGNSYA